MRTAKLLLRLIYRDGVDVPYRSTASLGWLLLSDLLSATLMCRSEDQSIWLGRPGCQDHGPPFRTIHAPKMALEMRMAIGHDTGVHHQSSS